MKEEEEDSW